MDHHKVPAVIEEQAAPSASPSSVPVAVRSRASIQVMATRARNDDELVDSWVAGLGSKHTRYNFEATARRFLAHLAHAGCRLQTATVEDCRDALALLTDGMSDASTKQHVLRVKSLLGYGHELGYLRFNAGARLKVTGMHWDVTKRIIGEAEVNDLIRAAARAAGDDRDRMVLATLYYGAPRVSELVALNVSDAIVSTEHGVRRVRIHILGKGAKPRNVLLPVGIGEDLLDHIAGRSDNEPLFFSKKRGTFRERLSVRGVQFMVKKYAEEANLPVKFSAHWLRHCHASHAEQRGASLALIKQTLGHSNIATTSVYLDARPGASSGDVLDPIIGRKREQTASGIGVQISPENLDV
jgi:integrase/recombinase XerD